MSFMREILNISPDHKGFVLQVQGEALQSGMIEPHDHEELEINLVIRGSGAYLLGGQVIPLLPGSLVWLPPLEPHFLTRPSPDLLMFVVVIRNTAGPDPAEPALKASRCRLISPDHFHALHALCSQLAEADVPEAPAPDPLRYAGTAFGRVQNELFRHPNPALLNAGLEYLRQLTKVALHHGKEPANTAALHPAIQQALTRIHQNPDQDSSNLRKLSQLCGLSQSRLSRIFHAQVGETLQDYRNRIRLTRFKEIQFKNPSFTKSQAAFAAGFGSYSQFHKTRKQMQVIER